MIRAAEEVAGHFGEVLVVLNSDKWLYKKKGYVFMCWEERAEIIRSIKGVRNVVSVDDADGTVCAAIEEHRPTHFGNGGDRTDRNTPEQDVCNELGIELVYGLGGTKVQSSQHLVEKEKNRK